MLDVTAVGWAVTLGAIALLFALDLVVSGRRRRPIKFGEAVAWSVFYVAVALAFGCVFGLVAGWRFGGQYFAGYVVEKSLSVDNLFVFVIVMSTFAVPEEHRHKVLTIGIVAALALRAVFIAVGAALLAAFSFMFVIFGVVLVVTAVQLFRHRDQDPSIDDNLLIAAARRWLPVTSEYDGGRLVSRSDSRRLVTPLFLAVLAIGSADVVFALDSIPAVFGVTREAYIVFAANAFALLGLRALFFLVTGLLDRLVYLAAGLSLLLAFIGVKLVLHFAHSQGAKVPDISTGTSLLVIAVILAVTTIASVLKARRDPEARARAGALREQRKSAAGSPLSDGRKERSRRMPRS
jgi:tellurite resistance protein TerC